MYASSHNSGTNPNVAKRLELERKLIVLESDVRRAQRVMEQAEMELHRNQQKLRQLETQNQDLTHARDRAANDLRMTQDEVRSVKKDLARVS